MHNWKLARLLVGSVAVLLFITACGGGDGGSGSQQPSSAGGTAGNAAPRIQGEPISSVAPSESYSFEPSVTDPNGDQLVFSATNVPAWASFDPATGRLSGTPSESDVGTYDGIVITVSDGKTTVSLQPFSITVGEGIGSAMLSWMPPLENADGTALIDLAGYQVRYGRSPDELSRVVELPDPGLSTYVIENLTSGTWYFAVAAVNSSGLTSDLSELASKTIS